jgi:hypothetical protein
MNQSISEGASHCFDEDRLQMFGGSDSRLSLCSSAVKPLITFDEESFLDLDWEEFPLNKKEKEAIQQQDGAPEQLFQPGPAPGPKSEDRKSKDISKPSIALQPPKSRGEKHVHLSRYKVEKNDCGKLEKASSSQSAEQEHKYAAMIRKNRRHKSDDDLAKSEHIPGRRQNNEDKLTLSEHGPRQENRDELDRSDRSDCSSQSRRPRNIRQELYSRQKSRPKLLNTGKSRRDLLSQSEHRVSRRSRLDGLSSRSDHKKTESRDSVIVQTELPRSRSLGRPEARRSRPHESQKRGSPVGRRRLKSPKDPSTTRSSSLKRNTSQNNLSPVRTGETGDSKSKSNPAGNRAKYQTPAPNGGVSLRRMARGSRRNMIGSESSKSPLQPKESSKSPPHPRSSPRRNLMDSAETSSSNIQLVGEFEVSGVVRASRRDRVKRMESVTSFFGKDGGELGASYHSPAHKGGDLSKVQSSIQESSNIDDMIRDLRRKNGRAMMKKLDTPETWVIE